MQIHIFTLFPQMCVGPFGESIIARAVARGLLTIHLHQFRDYTHDRHHTVDDAQYGGGPGMVLKPEPLFEAVESVVGAPPSCPVVLLTPQGKVFSQAHAKRLSAQPAIALICGHYGGVDERIREHLATEELSIGDYVLSGGELAAMVVVDAVARLVPGVLGDEESAGEDSHATGILQHPLYTRPAQFRDWPVPDVLLSGDHQAVAKWRRRQALLRTLARRPDLLENAALTDEERRWLEEGKARFCSP
ncbi:MAG: tRNA (guanosine(37)-N1)-methyltransferase TrmD [Dehalococcoidia bacterium]|nr:tRNA (guanosine(37)-N1)-methyltransferase TrmD [Dehalococcoidia bacterium]